jgi:hypothetical protein
VVGEGEVEVVAAEDQVLADGHPVEHHLAAAAAAGPGKALPDRPDADEREVARPAADVADEDRLARRTRSSQPAPWAAIQA